MAIFITFILTRSVSAKYHRRRQQEPKARSLVVFFFNFDSYFDFLHLHNICVLREAHWVPLLFPVRSHAYIYIYIYPFWRAIYGSDNFLQIPPMYELFNFIYFRRRGLYRCIEPSISEIHMILPASAGKFIYISEIYMILPASAGNFIYISN